MNPTPGTRTRSYEQSQEERERKREKKKKKKTTGAYSTVLLCLTTAVKQSKLSLQSFPSMTWKSKMYHNAHSLCALFFSFSSSSPPPFSVALTLIPILSPFWHALQSLFCLLPCPEQRNTSVLLYKWCEIENKWKQESRSRIHQILFILASFEYSSVVFHVWFFVITWILMKISDLWWYITMLLLIQI